MYKILLILDVLYTYRPPPADKADGQELIYCTDICLPNKQGVVDRTNVQFTEIGPKL